MGVRTGHTTSAATTLGQTIVTWTARARDGFATTPQRIARRFANTRDGDILLLHDGVEPASPHANRWATLDALPPLIESIRRKGLKPVRLDELLDRPAYQSPAPPRATAT
jgi:peptidoglycan/xylan/chitin deacetylase (PgdA/CDA1 family)